MTKEQLKQLIRECVCELQTSLEEKKHKKHVPKQEPKAETPKPAPVKKLVKKPTKKNLAKVAPPKEKLTAFDAIQLARRAADAQKRGDKQSARDLKLAQKAANHLLKTGRSLDQ